MTHDERNASIRETMEAYAKIALVDRASARKSLIESGIYTPSGKLRPEYGGPAIRKAKAKA
jgi:hypothetical protein